jgi:tetratricopeptide (TPR) repeat protein
MFNQGKVKQNKYRGYKVVVGIILTSIVVAGFPVFYIKRDEVARFFWQNAGISLPSSWIQKDAYLAKEIGEYYINWRQQGGYDLDKSKGYLARAYEIDKELSGVQYQLGRIAFLRNKLHSALLRFDEQTSLYGTADRDQYYFPTIYMQALTSGFLTRFNDAEEGFRSLIEENSEDPRSWAYYTDLAWVYFQQGKFEEIKELTSKGLERYPENPWILNMHGLALHNLDSTVEARNVLKRALMEANKLTALDWQLSYPGNDPRIAATGLSEMISTIESNLETTSTGVE